MRKVVLKADFKASNQAVVFVPGIKGSILEDSNGNVQWLDATQALGFSTPDLRLLGNSISLRPQGALYRISAIPYLIEVNVYAPWIEKMSKEDALDFYVFSYDWRKKNLSTRDQLILFLEELGKQYKSKPILIGHSMGGMISMSAINLKPTLVDKVVYVGVPFRGGIGYMKDLHVGVSTGLNQKIQSPCMIARYETVYGFFPRLNTWDSKDVVVDSKGQTLHLDLYNAKTWKENRLGFYANECKTEDIPLEEEFQNILDASRKFRESLTPTKKLLEVSMPTLVVHGNNLPVRKAMTKIETNVGTTSNKSTPQWDLEKAPKELGDGSVSYANSIPPEPIIFESFVSTYEHSVLLNDPKVQEVIISFITKKKVK
ncbi:lecithin:cholesterol acyltransferase domain protein [Leptospira ryugenii]|uniref:Lecithin:cholesterol acyltransferase domain protein n=1 Tax=Leptospira ryugenii TaxID=1917863 RepID=A0A2P2E2W1_9LEPT|nr:alpha/beta hydrolase [Leptospira ryugenii]GBF51235.1 lecithin:cholesterol acyltransferase domain protein [Leptospira ryugenii]